MDAIADLLFVFLGLFIGLLVWSRVARWAFSLYFAVREKRSAPAAAGSWAGIAMTGVLSSAPWLLISVAALAIYVLSRPHAAGWPWFFYGMLATPLLIALNVLTFLRRRRRARSA